MDSYKQLANKIITSIIAGMLVTIVSINLHNINNTMIEMNQKQVEILNNALDNIQDEYSRNIDLLKCNVMSNQYAMEQMFDGEYTLYRNEKMNELMMENKYKENSGK